MLRLDAATAAMLASLATPVAAPAHVSLEQSEVAAGIPVTLGLRVGHGCAGSPTTALSVALPAGFTLAAPEQKPGWTVAVDATPAGTTVSWRGGRLAGDRPDTFTLAGRLDAGLAAGTRVTFPAVQTCEAGEARWVAPDHAAADPAPAVTVAALTNGIAVTGAYARATPAGAEVGGVYLTLSNAGATADRLLGATTDVAAGAAVHEMRMDGDVMRMNALPDGLALAPGATVSLAPNGAHLMLTGLRRPLKEGDHLALTLRFEKAGEVPLDVLVGSIGARGADAHAGHKM